jgi:hypothetical protein
MKIEPAKNHSADRKESKNVFKPETSAFQTSNPLGSSVEPVPAPPTTSAFSKILEETRKQNEKDNSPAAKTDSSDTDSKTSKSEKDEKPARVADEKKEAEERGNGKGDSDARQEADENQSHLIALAALQTPAAATESKAPAARSILHITDLERIISSVRAETFQNQKQVVIALKNSVLQGLQIKLTLTESGKIKAEFLALDKQVEKQLNQRKRELAEILKNRSTLFSEVEVKSQNGDEKA